MENSFETLKTLGAQRIYETTHIAKLTIEHILNKDFESLNKVQFSGFISILEREYSVDLSALRAEFEGRVNEPIKKVEQAIYAPSKSKTLQYVSMALISIVLVVIFVLTQSNTSATEESALEINNSAIDQVKDKIQEPLIDTDELIITDQELQNINNNTVQEPILPTKLIIKPNTKKDFKDF